MTNDNSSLPSQGPANNSVESTPDMGDVSFTPSPLHITAGISGTSHSIVTQAAYWVDQLLADPVALLRLADALELAKVHRSHAQRLDKK